MVDEFGLAGASAIGKSMEILTDRLCLRPFVAADLPALADLYGRAEVVRWLGSARTPAERLARYLAPLPAPLMIRAITLREMPQKMLGTILLKDLPLSQGEAASERAEIEIGWHLHPDVWGRGYATEAARAVLQKAALPEVFAVIFPDNHASQAVARRLGMRGLGLTQRYYDQEVLLFMDDEKNYHQ